MSPSVIWVVRIYHGDGREIYGSAVSGIFSTAEAATAAAHAHIGPARVEEWQLRGSRYESEQSA